MGESVRLSYLIYPILSGDMGFIHEYELALFFMLWGKLQVDSILNFDVTKEQTDYHIPSSTQNV